MTRIEIRLEAEIEAIRGHCRVCGAETRGLRLFCDEHVFTEKCGFDPHTYNLEERK